MNTILKKIVWVIMLLPAVYLAIIWNKLPESIAMQYNLKGEPIRFGDKEELVVFAAIMIFMSAFVYLLLINIYRIDPKKYAAENKERLRRIAFVVVVFIACLQCLIYYTSVSGSIRFSMSAVFSGMGLLFAFIGNYLPNLKPNYFAGLRLPWTLENEENWKKTHLLAGKLWFAGGLALAVICLFVSSEAAIVVFFAVMTIIVIIPVIYSYKLYRKQKMGRQNGTA